MKQLLLCLVALWLCLPAAADSFGVVANTAYYFNCNGGGHEDGCDGGVVKIINNGSGTLTIDSVVLSGWAMIFHLQDNSHRHIQQEILMGGPVSVAPGDSAIFNSSLTKDPRWGFDLPPPGALFDSSNYGPLQDIHQGIVVDLFGHNNNGSFVWTYYDNINYALTFGCHGTTGGLAENDCDALGGNGMLFGETTLANIRSGQPGSPIPEPTTVLLFLTGLAPFVHTLRRKIV